MFLSALKSFINKSSTLSISRAVSSDTIFALSSGQGKCGVALIRVSGPHTKEAIKTVTSLKDLPEPRTALLRSIKHPKTKETLDKGLLLWFPGPKSFTGEDAFELHVHGGIAVINSVLDALGSLSNFRLADPGEFTRRAFHNAKLDLTEVEGIADLIQAETEFQRKQAYLQVEGALSKLYNNWKTALTKCVANVEAYIDFEETDTLELGLIQQVCKDIERLIQDIENHLSDGRRGEILRHGVKTIILGEPNVGKSSLLNMLCQRPAAIVTPIEGTTRDVLEITLNIDGYPLVVADTAGLRTETNDIIEQEGISRALKLYEISDLLLLVLDLGRFIHWKKTKNNNSLNDYVTEYIDSLNLGSIYKNGQFNKPCVLILNKSDLVTDKIDIDISNVIPISCKTGENVKGLTDAITEHLKILCGEPSQEHPSLSQIRHRQHLNECVRYLRLVLNEQINEETCDLVLMAEYLRKSLKNLGKLVGSVTTEQLLDVIFRDFCVGK